jgi:hypothetical protein
MAQKVMLEFIQYPRACTVKLLILLIPECNKLVRLAPLLNLRSRG